MVTHEGVDAAFTALFLGSVRPPDGWRKAPAIAFWVANLPPHMTDQQLRDAAIAYTRLPDGNAFWPTPGRLVDLAASIWGSDMLDTAEGAWAYVCRMLRKHGRNGPRLLEHQAPPKTRRVRRWNPKTGCHEIHAVEVEERPPAEVWVLHDDPTHRARLEAAVCAIGTDPWFQLCTADSQSLDFHRRAFCAQYAALLRGKEDVSALGIPETLPAGLLEAQDNVLDRATALDFVRELGRREAERRGGGR
jgi:hypothetical protein